MQDERRRHARAPMMMSADLAQGEESLGSFRVINLSEGGLLLDGMRPIAIGEELEVAMQLPGGAGLRITARVVREALSHRRMMFALAFRDITEEGRKAIAGAVGEALEQARTATVLLIDSCAESSFALQRSLFRLGCSAFPVTTLHEAVHCLEQENRFTTALVDRDLGPDDGKEMLVFLAEEHPAVRRVLMSSRLSKAELDREIDDMPFGTPDALLDKNENDQAVKLALGR